MYRKYFLHANQWIVLCNPCRASHTQCFFTSETMSLQDVIVDRDEEKWQKCRKVSRKYLWRGQILDLGHENGNICQDFQVKAALSFKFKSANSSSAFKTWNLGGLSFCHPVHACCFVWYTKVYIMVCFQIFSSAMEAILKFFEEKIPVSCSSCS